MQDFPGAVLERFAPLRQRGRYWHARCPNPQGHSRGDRHPSLSLWLGRGGCVMVGCWTGCNKHSLLAAVGLRMADLFPPTRRGKKPWQPPVMTRVTAVYDYRDESGALLYQCLRKEYLPPATGKFFTQRRPATSQDRTDDGWVYQLAGVRHVLYRTPDLANRPHWPVVLVEGEGKADRLADLGLLATCNVGGAHAGWSESVGKWLDSYSEQLRGRRVAILPDHDAPGKRHAHYVAGSLLWHGAAGVRIVQLPGLPEKGDVVDYLDAGGTKHDLLALIRSAPEWRAHPCQP